MSILYLLTAPAPIMEGTDAVFQEVAALRAAFQGEAVNLFPFKHPGPFPKQLFGLHKIFEISRAETRYKLNHLYFPVPHPLPVLRFLRNPVVHTISASLNRDKKPAHLARLRSLHRIVVSNERDAGILKAWGLSNFAVVPPGIDSSGLARASLPLASELTLLMASAPWVRKQFDLKGVDTLLATAATLPFLRLIFLWRGLLVRELAERVKRLGIGDRVEIVNRKVNLNDYLRQAHATVLLAKRGDIIKAFPHSLIESLIAGKPVLISDSIAMADYVRDRDCGIVVNDVSTGSVIAAIEALTGRYGQLTRNTAKIGPESFSMQSMVENYRGLYGI
jgi:glycosyltransferase involved in cell wall biosynthesis